MFCAYIYRRTEGSRVVDEQMPVAVISNTAGIYEDIDMQVDGYAILNFQIEQNASNYEKLTNVPRVSSTPMDYVDPRRSDYLRPTLEPDQPQSHVYANDTKA